MKKFAVLMVVALLSVSFVSLSYAEGSNTQNSLTGFFKRLFNYPVKATQDTATTVGNTLQNTGEKVVASTAENTAAIVTGDVAKTADLVTDNVTGVAETTGQTVAETVQIPVNAAEEHPAS